MAIVPEKEKGADDTPSMPAPAWLEERALQHGRSIEDPEHEIKHDANDPGTEPTLAKNRKPEGPSATAIRVALKKRYPPRSHALLFEVQAPQGNNIQAHRFADAIAVSLWPSDGFAIHGVEIKISRGDLLAELKRPDKASPILQHCHHWWLACPKGMAKPEDLPESWGLLEYSGGSLRVRKKAPKLDPIPPSPAMLASLCRRHAGADEDMTEAILGTRTREIRDTLNRHHEDSQKRLYQRAQLRTDAIYEQLDQVRAATGLDLTDGNNYTQDLIDAIRLVQAMGDGWRGGLSEIRRKLDETVKTLDRAGITGK